MGKPNIKPRVPGTAAPSAAPPAAPAASPETPAAPAATPEAAAPAAAVAPAAPAAEAPAAASTEGAAAPALAGGGEPAAAAQPQQRPDDELEPDGTEDREIPVTEENVNIARLILLAHARGDTHVDTTEEVSADEFTNQLVGSLLAGAGGVEGSATDTASAIVTRHNAHPGRLPEPHEVDPTKITRPVKTTKGTIVPAPKPKG